MSRADTACPCHAKAAEDGVHAGAVCPHRHEGDEEPCHETPRLDGSMRCSECAWKGSWP